MESTRILGVVIDNKLSNTAQCDMVKSKLSFKWWTIKKYCNPNWGLKLKTIMTIINATIVPNLFYAAPSWMISRANIDKFRVLTYHILSVACGARYKPERSTLECLTGFLPIETQLKVITTKFLIKNYVQHIDDNLTDTITLCANIPRHFTSGHINDLKRYYAFYFNDRSLNTVDLSCAATVAHNYSKASIRAFKLYCWNQLHANNPPSSGITPHKELKVIDLHCSRKHEAFIISLVHGHNVLNSFRFKRKLTASPLCICGNHETAEHILHCVHLLTDVKRPLEALRLACVANHIDYSIPAMVNARNLEVLSELVKVVKRLFVIRPDIPHRDLRTFS